MGSFLKLNLDKIKENAEKIVDLCHSAGSEIFAVTKVFCADPEITSVLVSSGIDGLADSRIDNLVKLKKMNTGLPLMLLRIASPSETDLIVSTADLSLNSELFTLKKLDDSCRATGKKHSVIIMIDIGDLREGILPENAEAFFLEALKYKHIEIAGIGTNTACFGGVIPTEKNMNSLLAVKRSLEERFSICLKTVTGGNSSALPLLLSGRMPGGINSYRIGETIVLGRNVINRAPFPGTQQDTFVFHGEIVEYKVKPSVPSGERGQNAFGENSDFPDRGNICRAIIAAGRQDLVIDGLTPADPEVSVLGGSSDHLIVEVRGDFSRYKTGDFVSFYPGYGCLLALMTSPYIKKVWQ